MMMKTDRTVNRNLHSTNITNSYILEKSQLSMIIIYHQ